MREKPSALSRRALLSAALGSAPALLAKRKPPEPRFHVLFVTFGGLRPALGCFGDPLAQTPNIDRVAAQGLTFQRNYCQQAAGSPSCASLITGLRPNSTGVLTGASELNLTLSLPTLGEHFMAQGYASKSFGKLFDGGAAAPNGQSWAALDGPDETDAPAVREAIRALTGHSRGLLFLSVGLRADSVFRAPRRYFEQYSPAGIDLAEESGLPLQAPPYVLHDSPELRGFSDVPQSGQIPPDKARELIHAYYAGVSYADALLGEMLQAIEARGLADQTAIVLCGDSGYHLGEHGLWGRHTNFEAATQTPLVVSFPGQSSRGRKTHALTELVDIFPSLCDICQAPRPEAGEGSSFAPLFENPDRLWKRAVFSQHPRNIPYVGDGAGYSMRTNRYRYTEWVVEQEQFRGIEVYDYLRDPHESRNIALRSENVSLVNGLAGMLQEGWRESVPPTHRLGS